MIRTKNDKIIRYERSGYNQKFKIPPPPAAIEPLEGESIIDFIDRENKVKEDYERSLEVPSMVRHRLNHYKPSIIYQYTRLDFPKSLDWLSRKYGISETAVRNALLRWKVPMKPMGIRGQTIRLNELKPAIIKDYETMNALQIAKKYGFSESGIMQNLKAWGVPVKDYTKVDPEEVRRMLFLGMSIEDIARRLGAQPSSIYKVRAEKLFITSTKKKRISGLEQNLIRNYYSRGLSISQIYRILKSRNLLKDHDSDTPVRAYIENHHLRQGSSIVSDDVLLSILGLARQGVNSLKISDTVLVPEGLVVETLRKYAPRKHPGIHLKMIPDFNDYVDAVRNLRMKGASRTVIMTATGLTESQVENIIEKYHIVGGEKVGRYPKEYLDSLAVKIRDLRLRKMTIPMIAEKLKANKVLIARVIEDYKIPYVKRVFDEPTRAKVRELYLADVHYGAIARRLGLKDESVRQEIMRMGLPKRDKPWNIRHQAYSPEEHRAQNDFIRRFYQAPYYRSIGELARLLKIDKTTIRVRLEELKLPIRSNIEGKHLRFKKRPTVYVPQSLKPLLHKRAIMIGEKQ